MLSSRLKVPIRANLHFAQNRFFTYRALIGNYENRKKIENHLENLNSDKKTYHAKWRTRVAYFVRTRRKRFIYLFLFLAAFQYVDNILKFIGARMERNYKNVKKFFIQRRYPEMFIDPTAQTVNYSTKSLSSQTEKVLGERFVELDRR